MTHISLPITSYQTKSKPVSSTSQVGDPNEPAVRKMAGFLMALVALTLVTLAAAPIVLMWIIENMPHQAEKTAGGGKAAPAMIAAASVAPAQSGASEGDRKAAAARGAELFASSCVACHGPDALGRPNLGKDLVHSKFVEGLSNKDMVTFLKRGRDASDPLNTTKIQMPPKGGNPALNDKQMDDIVAYLRKLQRGM